MGGEKNFSFAEYSTSPLLQPYFNLAFTSLRVKGFPLADKLILAGKLLILAAPRRPGVFTNPSLTAPSFHKMSFFHSKKAIYSAKTNLLSQQNPLIPMIMLFYDNSQI